MLDDGPSDSLSPLRSVTGGLSALITHYQRCVSNKRGAEWILWQMESLQKSFATPPPDRVELERRKTFIRKLGPISGKLVLIMQQGRRLGFVEDVDQAQRITRAIEDIRVAITDYQMSLQQAIYQRNCELIGAGTWHQICRWKDLTDESFKADRELLNKLPCAKGAGSFTEGEKCLAGTRVEVLREIETWAEDPKGRQIYWLNGASGGGKSAIARTLTERMCAVGNLGASFFCSRDFAERSDLHLIFPTLAYDLAFRYANFRAHLVKIIKSNPNIGHQSLSNQLERLLIEPLVRSGLATIIIIDALDECREPDNQPASVVLSLLARYVNSIPCVKFFITGRPEPRIQDGFRLPLLRPRTEVLLFHEIDPMSADQDIGIFLRDGLLQLTMNRNSMIETIRWPGDDVFSTVVRKSGGLFIYADTILKFIASTYGPPDLHLSLTGTSMGVDTLYAQLLEVAYPDVYVDAFRNVVGTVAVLFNPLSPTGLGCLLNMSLTSVYTALHPVFFVPNSGSNPIRIFHRSFAEYIADNSRCRNPIFYIDPTICHARITVHCFELMQTRLKKNICDLPPYAMNCDVEDLSMRRIVHIGEAVEYVCRFWVQHLKSAFTVDAYRPLLLELLKRFFDELLLYWLEVLSIIGRLRDAVHALHEVRAWLADVHVPDNSFLDLIADAERFILIYFDLIEQSAPHIYASALSWCPASSPIRNQYKDHLAFEVIGANPSWSSWIQSIQTDSTRPELEFSHKGDLIAVGGARLRVFESTTGACLATFGDSSCTAIAFSFDDTLLVSADFKGAIRLWDFQTGGLIRKLHWPPDRGKVQTSCCAFSPNGAFVAAGAYDGSIQVWNTSSGFHDCTLEGNAWAVTSLCWSRSGVMLSGYFDGTIKTWNTSMMSCSDTVRYFIWPSAVAFSPDCTFTAGFVGQTLKIYDTRTGELVSQISVENGVCSIRFSSKGDQIVFASQKSVCSWHFTRRARASSSQCNNDVTSVAISPDGNSVAFGTSDGLVRTLAVGGKNRRDRHTKMDCVHLLADGLLAASHGTDNTVMIWDARTGSCVQKLHAKKIDSVKLLPNHSLMASIRSYPSGPPVPSVGAQDRFLLCPVGDPISNGYEAIACYDYPSHSVLAVDGKLVALFEADGDVIKLWNGDTGAWMHTLGCHLGKIKSVVFSPDCSLVVCRTNSPVTAQIWNVQTGVLIFHFGQADGTRSGPTAATYYKDHDRAICAPNGALLASFWKWGTSLKLWNANTGDCIHTFTTTSRIRSVEFSPDSFHLVSSHGWIMAQDLRVWDVNTGELVIETGFSEFNIQSPSRSFSLPRVIQLAGLYIPPFCFSPNASRIVVWRHITDVDCWNFASQSPALNPRSKIILYDMTTGCRLAEKVVEYFIDRVYLSNDGTEISFTDVGGKVVTFEISIASHSNSPSAEPSERSASPRSLPFQLLPPDEEHRLLPLSLPPPLPPPSSSLPFSLSDDYTWVLSQTGMRICWIPPNYRGEVSGCHGNKFVIGTPSGRVVILDFSRTAALDSL